MQRFIRPSWLAITVVVGLVFYGLGSLGIGTLPPYAAHAQQVQPALPDAAEAIINQLKEMNAHLKEINGQLKEQNKMLGSSKPKVGSSGKSQ